MIKGKTATKIIIDDVREDYTLCGCSRHAVSLAGDVYAQHREWEATWNGREYRRPTGSLHHVHGIGISAPEAEPIALDDPTGDDVARDAYRTTGGRTLDDVIDGCRGPRVRAAESLTTAGLVGAVLEAPVVGVDYGITPGGVAYTLTLPEPTEADRLMREKIEAAARRTALADHARYILARLDAGTCTEEQARVWSKLYF